ncbi:MAG: MBL fold metallo-hydrolase [bacterium]|jgi:L-ascorbate metabolism protein UlaG (beta-lactamase superfamily)
MKIKWLGHSAFLLTAADGTKIITDPYVPGAYDGAVSYDRITERADAATVSHEHADHNGADLLPGKPRALKGTGPFTVGTVQITGIDTYHDPHQGQDRGKNTLFIFEIDRLRLVHCGDLGHLLTETTLQALGRVDVLLVPVGGLFTIDAPAAVQLIGQLKPKLVIPMHFKTHKLGFQIARVDEFARIAPRVRRIGKPEVEITAENLPPETETWILEPAL